LSRQAAPKSPAERRTGILLVCCDDQPGLVAALTQTLFDQGVNILDADQHTDELAGKFFQRIRFDLGPDGGSATHESVRAAVEPVATRHHMTWSLHAGDSRARVALFVSKTDHCLYDLLLRHRSGELACDIPLIVSNHDTLAPVAAQFGIAFELTPVTAETKPEQEARQLALIEEHRVDLVVLARYMQILSSDFIARHPARIINIHHSFLPAFQGGRPYHQAYERGVKLIGATAHYATTDLDEGPIIDQDVARVSHRDSVADLVRKGRDVERNVLARAVRAHLEHRVLVYENKTVVFD
jgi:formyltetrahydrofolate deformylase